MGWLCCQSSSVIAAISPRLFSSVDETVLTRPYYSQGENGK